MSEDFFPLSGAGFFPAGSLLAGYRLEERIGRGGMAEVFRAWDERLGRPVALKVLAPELAGDPLFRERFIKESRAAAAVREPHVIPVFEAGEASGVLFIAMLLVDGGDARSLARRNGALPPGRVAEIVSQVASALDAAHEQGLVHRDVKPANMLLDTRAGRPDHVYLSDFGLTKAPRGWGSRTASGQFLGTVDYAAPEQVNGGPVDGRTDQYALGCSAFELLCGEPPFRRDDLAAAVQAHLAGRPPSATSRLPWLPSEVDAVFARVLAKSAAERYGTCQEFADALQRALGLLLARGADAGSAPPRSATDVASLDHSGGARELTVSRNGNIPAVPGGAGPPAAADPQASKAEPGPSLAARPAAETPAPEEARNPMGENEEQAAPGREHPWWEKLKEFILGPVTSVFAAIIVVPGIRIGVKLVAAVVFVLFSAGVIFIPRPRIAWWKSLWPKLLLILAGAVAGVLIGIFIIAPHFPSAKKSPSPALTSAPACCTTTPTPSLSPSPAVKSVGPPPPASAVTVLMTKEAAAARARNPADAIRLYAPNAEVRDAACTTGGRPNTWRGLGQILQRYLNLPAFSALRHVDIQVMFTPDSALATNATATARTTGLITPSAKFPNGIKLGGAENWVFIRVNRTWLIRSFTYDLCSGG